MPSIEFDNQLLVVQGLYKEIDQSCPITSDTPKSKISAAATIFTCRSRTSDETMDPRKELRLDRVKPLTDISNKEICSKKSEDFKRLGDALFKLWAIKGKSEETTSHFTLTITSIDK